MAWGKILVREMIGAKTAVRNTSTKEIRNTHFLTCLRISAAVSKEHGKEKATILGLKLDQGSTHSTLCYRSVESLLA